MGKIPDLTFPFGTAKEVWDFYNYTRSVLNNGRYQMRVITSAPDWTTNDGEMVCVNDGTNKSLYMFITDNWYSVALTGLGTGGIIPVGGVIPFCGASSALPSGWALCNGAAISRATFSDLFAVIGTTYGVGDGSTTFNLPDLRDRFPLGVGNMGGVSPGRISEAASDVLGSGGGNEQSGTASMAGTSSDGGNSATVAAHTHTAIPPYQTFNYIIKI